MATARDASEIAAGKREALTREELYDLVWKEPMLRVGERMGVSSSYLARVCTHLRVPRPPRGYWAKLEFGKAPDKPPLPATRLGDATQWSPDKVLDKALPDTVPQPRAKAASRRSGKPAAATRHALLVGVESHFLKTRSIRNGLLKPFKRLLVDLVTSQQHLDAALDALNKLFLTFESKGHRVTLAPSGSHTRRHEVDEREVPRKTHFRDAVWSPERPTVVYIGDIAIGLTLFETSAETEVVYVNGDYKPVHELSAEQLRRYREPMHWRSTQDCLTGRFCLQAYCPSWGVPWLKQWRLSSAGALPSISDEVVKELELIAPELAQKITQAQAKAEAEHRAREEWWERERKKEGERPAVPS